MPFDPDAYLAKKIGAQQQGFDPDAYLSKKTQVDPDAMMISQDINPETVGAGDTFVQNFARGATFGIGDELGGHIEALGSKIGLRGLGSPYLRDVRLETDEEDAQPYSQVQEEMRDRRRGLLKQGEKENPVSSFLGNVAGGIATVPAGGALLKGASTLPTIGKAAQAGANMLTSGSKAAQLAKTGAVEGGLMAFGESEAETPQDLLFDTAKGASLGGVLSPVMGKGMEKVGKAVKWLGNEISQLKPTQKAVEVISNLAFDLPPKYTEELIKNPKAMNARSYDEIEEAVIKMSSKIKDDLMQEGRKAWSLLDDTPAVTGDDLSTIVTDNIKRLKLDKSQLPADVSAMKKAQSILDTFGVTAKTSDVDNKILQEADYILKTTGIGKNISHEELKILRQADDLKIQGNTISEKSIEKLKNQFAKESQIINQAEYITKNMGIGKKLSERDLKIINQADELKAGSGLTQDYIANLENQLKDTRSTIFKADLISKKSGIGKVLSPKDISILAKADEIRNTPNVANVLSEKDIKTIVQKLDREIDWVSPGMETTNEFLKNVRNELDSVIKGNPAYAKQMSERVKPLAESLKTVNEQLSLQRSGDSLRPTNQTRTVLKGMYDAQGNVKRPQTVNDLINVKTLDDLEKNNATSQMADIVNESKARGMLDRTEGGVTQGSRSVQAGGITGGAVGSLLTPIFGFAAPAIGAAAGATAGYIKDKYGRKIGKEFIDANRDKIINRDLLFQSLGQKIGRGAEAAQQAIPAVTRGINAAAIPSFVANELKKDPAKFDENEKRTVQKIWILKKNNPNLSEDEIKQYMQKSVPGYQRKTAAEEFLKD